MEKTEVRSQESEARMEQKKSIFDGLVEVKEEGSFYPIIEIRGMKWERRHTSYLNDIFSKDSNKEITIKDRAGKADCNIRFEIGHGHRLWRCRNFDSLIEAVEYALGQGIELREAAGVIWYRFFGDRKWEAAFSPGDKGDLFQHDEGDFSIERHLHRGNEYFSLRYSGNNYREGLDCRVLDFETAAKKCASIFIGLEWMRASMPQPKEEAKA